MQEIFENIYNKSKEEYFNYLRKLLKNNDKKFIITVNPEIIINSEKNNEIKEILINKNNSLVPDGISVVKKTKKYNIDIKER